MMARPQDRWVQPTWPNTPPYCRTCGDRPCVPEHGPYCSPECEHEALSEEQDPEDDDE